MPSDSFRLQLRTVRRSDWTWIRTWFRDEWLSRELGPVDEAWLDHVLADRNGVELVAEADGGPVGLTGVVWATRDHPFHTVTDLAIDPALRRQGLGRLVLAEVLAWTGHPPISTWVAYVAARNEPPARLLLSSGWSEEGTVNDMRTFRFEVQ